jgi:hypothetical protein
MGIYDKVNKRFAVSFYFREFDKYWRRFNSEGPFDINLIWFMMDIHSRIMHELNGKKDISVDGPQSLGFLVDSMVRNSVPADPRDVLVPVMVWSRTGYIPSDEGYDMALEGMLDRGEIPKNISY